MEKHKKAYPLLEEIFSKVKHLQSVQSLLHWDMETCMPGSAAPARGDEIATLSSVIDAVAADRGVDQLLKEAESEADRLLPDEQRNLVLMRRVWREYASVPSKLRKELAKAGTECCFLWREAKKEGDFNAIRPHLEKVVGLVRKIAAAKADFLSCTPYEALADSYDPGRKESELDALFKSLKETVPALIQEVCAAQRNAPKKKQAPRPLKLSVPVDEQRQFAHLLLQETGFDKAIGRLDTSAHPFCSGDKNNVRIATRYDENDVISGIMALMHESGHAAYQQNLPDDMPYQPICDSLGMGVHESQSLFVEMQLCRTRPFMRFLSKHLKKLAHSRSRTLDGDNLYETITHVSPSLIRVDADEVTYPAHVLVRYYIERYLINGDMEVTDIPDAWAQGYQKFLGVTPEDHAKGCLQDIHWMDGTFGYFPAYTVGAIYAAQLGEKARDDVETLADDLERGDFTTALAWLKENVHKHGSRLTPDGLIKQVCGEGLNPDAYVSYIRSKYLPDVEA